MARRIKKCPVCDGIGLDEVGESCELCDGTGFMITYDAADIVPLEYEDPQWPRGTEPIEPTDDEA